MENTESPLDVLSRAATMVQNNGSTSSHSFGEHSLLKPDSDNRDSPAKELPTKYKKEKRQPDYFISASQLKCKKNTFVLENSISEYQNDNDMKNSGLNGVSGLEEGPLDMTLKKRNSLSPPSPVQKLYAPLGMSHTSDASYMLPKSAVPQRLEAWSDSQPINMHLQRPSVITCASAQRICEEDGCLTESTENNSNHGNSCKVKNGNETKPRSNRGKEVRHGHRREITSACDPVIDEHFRRSLGKDYQNVFSPNPPSNTAASKTNIIGCSVDDHFAKALGETWLKLQAKTQDSAKATSEKGLSSDLGSRSRLLST